MQSKTLPLAGPPRCIVKARSCAPLLRQMCIALRQTCADSSLLVHGLAEEVHAYESEA